MSTIIETDLKEILGQINQKLDIISKDVTDIKLEVATTKTELKGEIKTLDEKLSGQNKALDEKLSGQNKALDEKVTGLSKRLDNQEFVSRSIVVALVIAILGGFAKLFGLVGKP